MSFVLDEQGKRELKTQLGSGDKYKCDLFQAAQELCEKLDLAQGNLSNDGVHIPVTGYFATSNRGHETKITGTVSCIEGDISCSIAVEHKYPTSEIASSMRLIVGDYCYFSGWSFS